jgi:hypothetical protein
MREPTFPVAPVTRMSLGLVDAGLIIGELNMWDGFKRGIGTQCLALKLLDAQLVDLAFDE